MVSSPARGAAPPGAHPVTVTIDAEHPGRPLVWFGEQGYPEIQLAWFPEGQSLAVVGRKYRGGPNTIFFLSVDDGEKSAAQQAQFARVELERGSRLDEN